MTRELQASDGRFYELRLTPFKGQDLSIRGAVLVLVDMDQRGRRSEQQRNAGRYAERFLQALPQPLLLLDAKLRIAWANPLFLDRFQVAVEETVGVEFSQFGGGEWKSPELSGKLAAALEGVPFRDHEIMHSFPAGGKRRLRLGGALVPGFKGEGPMLLLTFEVEERG